MEYKLLIIKSKTMRRKRKNSFIVFISLLGILSGSAGQLKAQQNDEVAATTPDSTITKGALETRNVMLNAESATSPRDINIGLPFLGDVLICENDVPVVYTFWTQTPTTVWRFDSSIGRAGLMSFQEAALTFGKVGYMVTTWDREAGRKFGGYAEAYTTGFGTVRYDVNISGPIKNGWGYTASVYENYERLSGANLKYDPYVERTEIFKVGINKRYDNGRVSFLYKYANSHMNAMGMYAPFRYKGDGKTETIDGLRYGTNSYIIGSGLFPYQDVFTNEQKVGDLTSDEASQSLSHAFYLNGEHRFKNKMKLTYSSMFMKSKATFTTAFPVSLNIEESDKRADGTSYTPVGEKEVWPGAVQTVSMQYYPQVDIHTFLARAELTKKIEAHDLRLGFTYQYYSAPQIQHGSMYYQTVEENPRVLTSSQYGGYYIPTNDDGLLVGWGTGAYRDDKTSKTALYVSDKFSVGKRFVFGLGARIEHENKNIERSPYVLDINSHLDEMQEYNFKHKWNKVFNADAVIRITNEFGLLGDISYNDWFNQYFDFPRDADGNATSSVRTASVDANQKVINYGGGIYWNHGKLFSLVSKVTRIQKTNNTTGANYTNPNNPADNVSFNYSYDISTVGWSTDIISEPFKNFQLHFLFTLQDPLFKNYEVNVPWSDGTSTVYNYNDKVVPGLSKVLMEIDPSYYMFKRDLRLWVSLRYFGNQQANKPNTIYYNGWWENFGGVDYKLSRNVTLKLMVTNFLNQKGIKGTLQGGDQIMDEKAYIGQMMVASGIRPRTLELSAAFKF
jgi:hypothetical protein